MSKPLRTSVIICAYTEKRWADLAAAVNSVQNQTCLPDEIIVVVDHNPNLLERVRTQLAGIRAIENQEAQGLGGARNSGIAVAQGAVIAFLDDDAVAAPDWLEQINVGYQDENVLGVGGSIEPLWLSSRPTWFPEEFQWVVGCTYRGMPQTSAPVRNLIGCNMSLRREVFDTLGGFRLGYGCDETEFCIRVHQQWPQKFLLYNPKAKVKHKVPADRAQWRYFRSRCYFEGRSKAVVSWLVGRKAGLDAERSYTLRTLPKGVVQGVVDTVRHSDKAGLARAFFIVAGLATTTLGYLSGSLSVVEAARERGWSEQPQQRTA